METDRRILLIVRSFLERTINFISPGFFFWFRASETLRGIRFTVENFGIATLKVLLVLYSFDAVWHRQWKLCHLRDTRFIAGNHCGFELCPKHRKISPGRLRLRVDG